MNDIKKLLEAVGALSELAKATYDALLKAGFSKDEALRLSGGLLTSFFKKD